jgi:hypothetical protein
MSECLRDGCARAAKRDEFCSTVCAKLHYGTAPASRESPSERRNRKSRLRRLREKHGDAIVAPNPDAMSRRVAGSFESGKRR